MYKNIFLGILLTLQGCWFAPEPAYIEFDNQTNTIEVISEDYYIKNVKVAEYVQQQGYIQIVDSSSVIIHQNGQRGATSLCISKADEYYLVHGNNLNALLTKPNLHFEVQLEKFENHKKQDSSDIKIISFVKDVTAPKKKYNSKIP